MSFQQNYTNLPPECYAQVNIEAMQDPQLVHANATLLQELGLNLNPDELLAMTSGQTLPAGLSPLAQKYTGHQFGYYNPHLGDGRGVLLGQAVDAQQQSWDLHLKGSGQTPFSRRGDGRAVLRSAVREYLIGEALHALDVPTTRCLSLCHSPEPVRRESIETRAMYIRVAKTHLRFGHFEWAAQQNDLNLQQKLADFAIDTVYPELNAIEDKTMRYGELLKTIMKNTATMIAAWQAVGFCHGVMNTDNMSIAGETFDFGPFAFLDDCQLHYICNHSDSEGRYAYSQQPNIGLWNCQVLGQAFTQLASAEAIDEAVDLYIETYNQAYLEKMSAKFGLLKPQKADKLLIADALILLDKKALDFHQFFYHLQFLAGTDSSALIAFLGEKNGVDPAWQEWLERYQHRIQEQDPQHTQQRIKTHAPQLVLRNYILQEIIQTTLEDFNADSSNNMATQLGSNLFSYQPQNILSGQATLANWVDWIRDPFNDQHPLKAKQKSYFASPSPQQKNIVLSCSS